jgi:serine phosphatase RsbU (regulator of sigma subunit)
MISSLTLGAYRNGRRNGLSLTETAAEIDTVIQRQFADSSYVTGQMAELDTINGTLHWLNAGHPLPLLVRDGRAIDHLQCRPRPPFGLDDLHDREPEVAVEQLQPGDAVLLYSDGVIEHRSAAGTDYGIDRLRDFLQKAFAAQMSPDETLRRLSNAILDFHGGTLRDDATTILVVWEHDE